MGGLELETVLSSEKAEDSTSGSVPKTPRPALEI